MNAESHVRIEGLLCAAERPKAALMRRGDDEFWIPLSQILERGFMPDGRSGWILIPRWLAEEKGLVDGNLDTR